MGPECRRPASSKRQARAQDPAPRGPRLGSPRVQNGISARETRCGCAESWVTPIGKLRALWEKTTHGYHQELCHRDLEPAGGIGRTACEMVSRMAAASCWRLLLATRPRLRFRYPRDDRGHAGRLYRGVDVFGLGCARSGGWRCESELGSRLRRPDRRSVAHRLRRRVLRLPRGPRVLLLGPRRFVQDRDLTCALRSVRRRLHGQRREGWRNPGALRTSRRPACESLLRRLVLRAFFAYEFRCMEPIPLSRLDP